MYHILTQTFALLCLYVLIRREQYLILNIITYGSNTKSYSGEHKDFFQKFNILQDNLKRHPKNF